MTEVNREELEMFRDMLLKVMEAEVAPHYEQWDEQGIMPRELWNTLGDAGLLLEALRLYHRLTQVLRLALSGKFVPAEAPRGVLDLLVQASGSPTFTRLQAELADLQVKVRETFVRLIGEVETVNT